MIGSLDTLNADILCVQELDVYSLRTRLVHQPKLIANKLGYDFVTSKVRFFGAGFQHNAIFSRFPLTAAEQIDLPKAPGEQLRRALMVKCQVGERTIGIATTHLHSHGRISDPNPRACEQLRVFLRHCEEFGIEIIGGDLNLLHDDVVAIARKHGFEAPHEFPTSPSKTPKHQIDWILHRGVDLNQVEVSPPMCSDHRALTARVKVG